MIIDLSFAKEYHIKKDKPKEELNSFLKAYKESCESTYDLQGRPAENPQKGILVKSGKKVLIK